MISIDNAFQLLTESVKAFPPEIVELRHSAGRLLAKNITADVDSPPHRKSVMDGFAIRSEDMRNGLRKLKVVGNDRCRFVAPTRVQTGEASRIMTGAPVPDGADAVVMIEQTTSGSSQGSETVVIEVESISAGKHTMEKAANFAKGDTIFPMGHRIRPGDIGLLAEVGAHRSPSARCLPRRFFLPGTNWSNVTRSPRRGKSEIAMVRCCSDCADSLGLSTTDLGIGRDHPAALEAAIRNGLEHDLLLLSGGVSAGQLDLVPASWKPKASKPYFTKSKSNLENRSGLAFWIER